VEGGSISTPATVVLGCTHFPVFRAALDTLLPSGTVVVDSAATTARRVAAALGTTRAGTGSLELLATDGVRRFRRVGSYFLGRPVETVELVDL
jgi:glutamate racemase